MLSGSTSIARGFEHSELRLCFPSRVMNDSLLLVSGIPLMPGCCVCGTWSSTCFSKHMALNWSFFICFLKALGASKRRGVMYRLTFALSASLCCACRAVYIMLKWTVLFVPLCVLCFVSRVCLQKQRGRRYVFRHVKKRKKISTAAIFAKAIYIDGARLMGPNSMSLVIWVHWSIVLEIAKVVILLGVVCKKYSMLL